MLKKRTKLSKLCNLVYGGFMTNAVLNLGPAFVSFGFLNILEYANFPKEQIEVIREMLMILQVRH